MDRLGRIAATLRSLDLGASATVEGRTFIGPPEAISRLRDLEDMASALQSRDLFSLYERTIAHDGIFDESGAGESGRYYAYLSFELKGTTPEEKEAGLASALEDLVSKYGKEELLPRIPARIRGRQVTEALTLRPEADDFPAYYSKSRMAYAEKMAVEELPRAVLAGIRGDQERLLDGFGWTSVRVQDKDGEVVDICGDAYALAQEGLAATAPYRSIWSELVSKGCDAFYDFEVRTDGMYAPDVDNAIGRYYAYVRASLKGQSAEEQRSRLLAALPPEAVEAIGADGAAALFREGFDGDQVTASLTIRPEAEEFPSYFNAKKTESGKERARKQILIDVQARVLEAVERSLGSTSKYIILE